MNKTKMACITLLFGIFLFPARGEGEIQPIRLLEPPSRSSSPGIFQVFTDKILFSWPEIKKATLYHIEISSSDSYSTLIIEAEMVDNKLLVDDLPEDIYFWHVSCINSEGLEGRFSQTFIYYHIN
ncbi:MAG: hypothetical protein U9N73_08860 [Candidatus Auribacterota bacterium]|nr:hypothetical protein [Candidatus Auribacterota bacterium]